MFYCQQCAADLNWPDSVYQSRGRCEMCAGYAVCNDRNSGTLPEGPEEGKRAVGARYRLNTMAQTRHVIQEEP